VRWTETVTSITTGGVQTVVECGPGQVLLALVKRIEKRRETKVFALADPDSFTAASIAAAA
jgi:[acyl-carrier-protein] S-malonyltransferase